mmetsp:Transcript_3860/g.6766  ORF Transcript_3860/g.6766 Transcript_3860/m.6766 type:complete len:1674 (-) Transcript_3860:431-5452(-)
MFNCNLRLPPSIVTFELTADHGLTLDEFAFFSRALTPSEMAAIYRHSIPTNHADLIGYWKFDEGSGSVAHDSSPNGPDLVLTNPSVGNFPTVWRPSRAPVYGSGLQVAYAMPSVTTLVDLSYLAPSAADLPHTTFCLVTPPSAGQLNYDACSSDPIYTYRADSPLTSPDTATFRITISDSDGAAVRSFTADLTLIDPSIDPLQFVQSIHIHGVEDSPYGLALPISGGDHPSRHVVVTSLPQGYLYRSDDLVQMTKLLVTDDIGNLTEIGLDLVFHPFLNENGNPLTYFSYKVWDDFNDPVEGMVVISIESVLDIPEIYDELYVTHEGTPLVIKLNVTSVETSVVFAILQQLPRHGKLYHYDPSAPDLLGPQLVSDSGSSTKLVQAWATHFLGASSEYGSCDTGYGGCSAVGKHDVLQYGDDLHAWEPYYAMSAPENPYDFSEYLELSYNLSLHVSAVEIWETFNPGSIVRVLLRNPSGAWEAIWSGDPLTCLPDKIRIFSPDFCTTNFQTDAIRIEMNTASFPGYKSIDAVMLIGSKDWGPGVVISDHSDFEVVYVPDKYVNDDDAIGNPLDSFSFKVAPCSYYHSYRDEPLSTLTATVSVIPVNDVPTSSSSVQSVSEGVLSVIWLRSWDPDMHQNHTAIITALPSSGSLYEPLLSDAPYSVSQSIHPGTPILSARWAVGCGPIVNSSSVVASLPAFCASHNLTAAVSDEPNSQRAGFSFAVPVLYEAATGRNCVTGNYSFRYIMSDGLAGSPEATITLRISCKPLTCSSGFYADTQSYECLPCPHGTFESAGSCVPCPVGSLTDSSGSVQCDKCSPGTFSATLGSVECHKCPMGFYTDVRGSNSCLPCPAGKFSNAEGSPQCALCFKGFYQPDIGQTVCLSCPKGYMSSDTGSTVCTPCSSGSYNDDIARGQCKEAPAGFFISEVAAVAALPCPEHAITLTEASTSDTDCFCKPGYYSEMPLQMNTSWSCIKCPTDGAICDGGTSFISDEGWWLPWWDRYNPVECESDACLRGGFCATGYKNESTNPICSDCIEGYTRSNEFECKKCPPDDENKAMMFVTFLTFCVVATYIVWSALRSAHSRNLTVSIVLKILVNFVQINSVIPGLPLKWPSMILNLFHYQGNLTDSFETIMSVECLLRGPETGPNISNFYLKVMFYLALPVLAVVVPAVGWFTFYLLRRHLTRPVFRLWSLIVGHTVEEPDPLPVKSEVQDVFDKFIATAAIALFMVYPGVSLTTLKLFRCKNLGTDHSFLVHDMHIQCYTPEHKYYILVLGVPSILVYIIGIPLVTLAILYRGRKHLTDPRFEIRFAFLYKGYKEEFYWWEMAVITRKILVIFITIYFASSVWLQTLLALGVLVIAVLANGRAMPYEWKIVAYLDLVSVSVSMTSIYLGLYFKTGVASDGLVGGTVATVILMAMNLLFACFFAYALVGILLKKFRKSLSYLQKSFRVRSWASSLPRYRITSIGGRSMNSDDDDPSTHGTQPPNDPKRKSSGFSSIISKRSKTPVRFGGAVADAEEVVVPPELPASILPAVPQSLDVESGQDCINVTSQPSSTVGTAVCQWFMCEPDDPSPENHPAFDGRGLLQLTSAWPSFSETNPESTAPSNRHGDAPEEALSVSKRSLLELQSPAPANPHEDSSDDVPAPEAGPTALAQLVHTASFPIKNGPILERQ